MTCLLNGYATPTMIKANYQIVTQFNREFYFNLIAQGYQTEIWQTWGRTEREKTEKKGDNGRVYGGQCSCEMDRAEKWET